MDEPLYRRVGRKIEERILSGAYRRGTTLPSESVLEREFGVSRVTVRQALSLLKHRGLLYSRSGLGTVVRAGGPAPSTMRMTGSLADLINYGAETDYSSRARWSSLRRSGSPRARPCFAFAAPGVARAPSASRSRRSGYRGTSVAC